MISAESYFLFVAPVAALAFAGAATWIFFRATRGLRRRIDAAEAKRAAQAASGQFRAETRAGGTSVSVMSIAPETFRTPTTHG